MAETHAERDDDADAALLAAILLDRGRQVHMTAFGLMVGAFALAMPAFGRVNPLAVALDGAAVLLYFAGLYFAIRVAIDAAIFRALGRQALDLPRLDRLLLRFHLLPAEKVGRRMDVRIEGAMRLITWQAGCLVAQLVLLITAALALLFVT